jgi:hypothetical protein
MGSKPVGRDNVIGRHAGFVPLGTLRCTLLRRYCGHRLHHLARRRNLAPTVDTATRKTRELISSKPAVQRPSPLKRHPGGTAKTLPLRKGMSVLVPIAPELTLA